MRRALGIVGPGIALVNNAQYLAQIFPLSLERQVSVNQFKIGAVGERFAIKVFDQDPNRSSSRDGRRECPCFFPSILAISQTYGRSFPSKRCLILQGSTDHGIGFSPSSYSNLRP
jgi:hypothetical protein